MSPKLNRKLTNGLSGDPYSSILNDDNSNQITLNTNSVDEKPQLKREEFICSTAHNAHLQEDFLVDKSSLFGRPLPHHSSHATRHSKGTTGATLKHVSSERLLRKFGRPKSLDTQSLRSVPHQDTSTFLPSVPEESGKERAIQPFKKTTRSKSDENTETKEHKEDVDEPIPRRPSRRLRRSRKKKSNTQLTLTQEVDSDNTVVIQNGDCHALRDIDSQESHEETPGRPLRPRRLSRQNSVQRPLYCSPSSSTETPRLFRRDTVTHELSHHSDMAEGPISQVNQQTEMTTSTTQGLTMPLTVNGRFNNPWPTWKTPTVMNVLRWKIFEKDNTGLPNSKQLDEDLKVVPLDKESIFTPPDDGIRVTWLGHSSTLVQFDGISVLTDPIFSERASPFRFFGPKRYRPFPGTIKDFPDQLDAVVISHNHYDHLDYNSVVLLNARYGETLHWFVPMGLKPWFQDCGCKNVQELSWWDKGHLTGDDKGATFVFTPSQHWSRRGLTDHNKTLWGSWCVLGQRHRFFFAGDTGYCDVFQQIGQQYGPFHLAAIPIGAYAPRWMMRPQHVDYSEAVTIHSDVKALRSLGIHWGTFALTYEYFLEPKLELEKTLKERNLEKSDFFVLQHGECCLVD